ncbi:MAG TPA: hypothetical protein VKA13_07375 [Gammaproteobacteria bacterium]|nr:hypothetical protein [Gammaproteobacteria bacterium]
MAETNYKKLLGLMGGAALLVAGFALTGCASAPEKEGAQGAEGGAAQEGTASAQGQASKGEASQGTEGGADQSGAGSSQEAAGGGKGADKTAQAAKPAKAEPPKPDISGSDVTAVENKMKLFPRVLWHSHTNTYRFYVGTVLFAEYSPYDDTFQVMTDNADQKNLVCKYAPGKGWQVEGKSKGATCEDLLKKMNDFLTHPFS